MVDIWVAVLIGAASLAIGAFFSWLGLRLNKQSLIRSELREIEKAEEEKRRVEAEYRAKAADIQVESFKIGHRTARLTLKNHGETKATEVYVDLLNGGGHFQFDPRPAESLWPDKTAVFVTNLGAVHALNTYVFGAGFNIRIRWMDPYLGQQEKEIREWGDLPQGAIRPLVAPHDKRWNELLPDGYPQDKAKS